MRILITGGTGFIGEYFIPRLIEENHNITLLVRNIEKARSLFEDKVKYIIGDVTDKNSIVGCCKDIDIVYHMVAKVGNELPNESNIRKFNEVNVDGTLNMVEEAKKYNVKKFIFVSSIAAMGIVRDKVITEVSKCSPYLPYQVSKHDAEMKLLEEYKNNNFPIIILRPTKVYGIGEHEYSFLKQIKLLKKGINLIIGKKENYISNICINDFVEALANCIDFGKIGEVYILSGKNSISSNQIKKIVETELKIKTHTIRIPYKIMISLTFIEEKIFLLFRKKPLITVQNVKAMNEDRIYDLSKAKKELNYEPQISMEEGINMMIQWYNENGLI